MGKRSATMLKILSPIGILIALVVMARRIEVHSISFFFGACSIVFSLMALEIIDYYQRKKKGLRDECSGKRKK